MPIIDDRKYLSNLKRDVEIALVQQLNEAYDDKLKFIYDVDLLYDGLVDIKLVDNFGTHNGLQNNKFRMSIDLDTIKGLTVYCRRRRNSDLEYSDPNMLQKLYDIIDETLENHNINLRAQR